MKSLYEAVRVFSSGDCVVALDRDGTLVPYADRPEDARVTPALQNVIYRLAAVPGVHVAVVSARSVAQLRGDFDYRQVILAGNYGVEVLLPDGQLVIQPDALRSVPVLKTVRDDLFAALDRYCGAILEDHGYSLCLHWHQVPLAAREPLHTVVSAVADRYPGVRFSKLPSSYEVLPGFPWDKGMALAWIDSYLPGASNYFFAGDSTSDSPAFRWINEHNGVSVRVGCPEALGAQFTVPAPAELHRLLTYMSQCRIGDAR